MLFATGIGAIIAGILIVYTFRARADREIHPALAYPGAEASVAIFCALLVMGGLLCVVAGVVSFFDD